MSQVSFHITPLFVAGVLNALSSFAFGLFVLWRSPDRRLGRTWFWFTITITLYGLGLAWIGIAQTITQATWAWRFLYGCGIFWIAPALLHFITTFIEVPRPRWIKANYLIALLFCCTLPGPYFLSSYRWFFNSIFFATGGPLFIPFLVWWIGLVIYTHFVMLQALPRLSPSRQNQVKYLLFATILGFCGGSYGYLANLGFDLYPWGNYTVCIYPAIMAIAIVRHQLLDIRVVIRKTIVYSAVTAILSALYIVLVTMVSRGLGGWVKTVGIYSSIAATAVIAVLFQPLLVRVQRWVNRRFPTESIDPVFLREATGRFIHEIKRPLARITLPVQLALADLEDLLEESPETNRARVEKLRKRLEFVLIESMDAAHRIEAIREVSADPGALESIDIKAILDRIIGTFVEDFRVNSISVEKHIPEDLPKIMGHPRQLEVAVSNIVRNAVEALGGTDTARPRRLSLQAAREASRLVIRIGDNGPGIAPADLTRIFEPYFSSKGSKGMGLGLYLVDQIMRQHHGSVEAQSSSGATFVLSFPLATHI